ncbi:unnamed protein product [Diabrotica balteata]|uniref:Uncharacterized protein n=1 Tax=Diabrotica balteata TaxID=107213 RepID=A0A9N9XGL3_DIABA|nr:unnamed protein product [Diabrotica balteata]
MKFFGVLLMVMAIIFQVFGTPTPSLSGVENIEDHSRAKRLACDILNPIQVLDLNVGEALCANLCKLQGKAGGGCTPDKNCECN